jgi:hypothetical protein
MRTTPSEYHCQGWFCRAFSHWLNPLGNWIEPLPYPEKRKLRADESWLPNPVWWFLRNPAVNLMSHWLGIMPVRGRYETWSPEDNGWTRIRVTDRYSFWLKRNRLPLPYYRIDGKWTFYIGWRSSGAFGAALRRNG